MHVSLLEKRKAKCPASFQAWLVPQVSSQSGTGE